MSGINYIALTDLLCRREAEFVAVWKCEQEVRRLLGGLDYPFAAPPELPSRQPVKRKPVVTRKPVAEAEPLPIRELRGAENAYRVSYQFDGRRESTFQTDASLIATLLKVRNEAFKVCKVEAVVFESLEKWSVTETVWSEESVSGGKA